MWWPYVEKLLFIILGAIITIFITRWFEGNKESKQFEEKIKLIAPLIREELRENIKLYEEWWNDWNSFFSYGNPKKWFKNEQLDLYKDDLSRWSSKNSSKLYLINGIIEEMNKLINTSQGRAKQVSRIRDLTVEMNTIIINLKDPFKIGLR